jgi:hypothetical protein
LTIFTAQPKNRNKPFLAGGRNHPVKFGKLRLLSLLFIGATFVLIGCGSGFAVKVEDIPRLSLFKEKPAEFVSDEGERVTVEEKFNPRLRMKLRSGYTLYAPLELVEVRDDVIHLAKGKFMHHRTFSDRTVPVSHVESVQISLEGYVPPDWDPTWGLALNLGGMGGLIGVGAQFFPWDWLVIETGIVNSFVLGVGIHTGLRLRPIKLGRFVPFVGGSVLSLIKFAFSSHDEVEASPDVAVCPRAGVDIEFFNGRFLLGFEIDLVLFSSLKESGFDSTDMHLWGGMSLVWLF